MIQLKIYNSDELRTWNYFPKMKDPSVLEKSLLRILNEYFGSLNQPTEKEFNIFNQRIANLYFPYYSSSNFYSWGQLPMNYIFNDMVRHIQNLNTKNNFIMTLESIYFDSNSIVRFYNNGNGIEGGFVAYDILTAYLVENYLNSYNFIINNNNGILTIPIPKNGGIIFYIVAVGFNPNYMAKWFCTSENSEDPNALPAQRVRSLTEIVRLKLGSMNTINDDRDLIVYGEYSDARIRNDITMCNTLIDKRYDMEYIRKKSKLDTEIKFGNYALDYNTLDIYDSARPVVMYDYTSPSMEKSQLNLFCQPDCQLDYRLLRKENEMISAYNKRNGIIE